MTEALISLFKGRTDAEQGVLAKYHHLEFAVAEWVDWYYRRPHGELSHLPPVEYERMKTPAVQPEPASISN